MYTLVSTRSPAAATATPDIIVYTPDVANMELEGAVPFQKQLHFSSPSPVAAVGNNICRGSGSSGVTGACSRCFHFHSQGRT